MVDPMEITALILEDETDDAKVEIADLMEDYVKNNIILKQETIS